MSRDNDLLDRLSGNPPDDDFNDATPIPVRIERDARSAADEALRRAREEERQGEEIVREYESKYYGTRETASRRKRAEELARSKYRTTMRRIEWRISNQPVEGLTADERLWATIAHLSFLLTGITAIVTDGWAVLAMMFVPLAIYFNFREKSDFIAFHALQAFAAQVIGTIGWAVMLAVGSVVFSIAIAVSAVASVILIGIPFVIVFSLLFVVFVLMMLLLPVAILILSLVGAGNTYGGRDFRYPVIAQWIDQQVAGTGPATL